MNGTNQIMSQQNSRLAINTPNLSPKRSINDSLFMQTYTVGYNPYSTLPVRFSTSLKRGPTIKNSDYKFKLKQIINSPFRRISRVEKIICDQKNQNKDENKDVDEVEILTNSYVFKPQFKVKTKKSEIHKHQEQLIDHPSQQLAVKVHLKNISLEDQNGTEFKEEHKNVQNLNYFQENLKNKMRITKKNQKKKQQSSLLQMLNRLSNSTPLQRYKSKPVSPLMAAFPLGVNP